jgi:hypothetical protein
MSEKTSKPVTDARTASSDASASGRDQTASIALARRQMLVKGLSKGAVVFAAAVPIQTLAAQVSLTPTGKGGIAGGFRCTISGQMSGVHSKETIQATCNGRAPDKWGVAGNWPTGAIPGEAYKVKFPSPRLSKVVVPASGTPGKPDYVAESKHVPSLFEVMSLSTYAGSQTSHWIGAWLNGLSGANNFPYTGDEILAFYNSTNATTKNNAYLLITNYLEML